MYREFLLFKNEAYPYSKILHISFLKEKNKDTETNAKWLFTAAFSLTYPPPPTPALFLGTDNTLT